MNQSQPKRTLVQTMKHLVPMRFRLNHNSKNHQSFIAQLKSPQHSQNQNQPFELKFCEALSHHHLLIGNQDQINLINLTAITEEYPEVSSQWTLSFAQKITSIYIIRRIHKLFIVCDRYVYCYGYRDDSLQTPPIFYQKLTLKSSIDSIYLPKKDHLLIFAGNKFTIYEMYNPHGIFQFKCIAEKNYRSTDSLKFVSIPQENGFGFSVFLSQQKQEQRGEQNLKVSLWQPKTRLSLYSIRITFNNASDVTVSGTELFCDISSSSREISSIEIRHYKENIFILQFGLSVVAARQKYILDSINFKALNVNGFVVMLSSRNLLLLQNGIIDHYQYDLTQSRKPQQFQLRCIDSLPFEPPEGSTFFSVKQMGLRLVILTQKIQIQSKQLRYWLMIAESTQKDQKVKEILPEKLLPQQELGSETIDQKIKAACKIGFTKSQAYFQLWSRSAKTTKRNYQLLIATENYDLIREQLEKKLKTHSLSYHEVALVLKSSLDMLCHKVRQAYTSKTIKQYAMCHFLSSKVEMFEKIKRNTSELNEDITISIQDYYYLNGIELQSYLFQLLGQLLIDRKPVTIKIRALLSQFGLIFRMLYDKILPRMIEFFVDHLEYLLQTIPEILPIEAIAQDSQDIRNNLWIKFELIDTKDYFIMEHINNLQTQDYIQQFQQSNFFKVYQWNLHGAITQSIEHLTQLLQTHNIEYIFTKFYAMLFLQKQKNSSNSPCSPKKTNLNDQSFEKIIDLVETQYGLLPRRLKGKFTFYSELYKRFKNFYSIDRKSIIDVVEFFSLSEEQLFHLYFRKEREQKGIFILRQIKPVYQRSAKDGSLIFLRNMFTFFKSDQSTWSDLKIILNKLNNQKEDFHLSNQPIISVLIKAIMEKVYIGTGHPDDIDLRQVISYIQNLPIQAKNSDLIMNVIVIRQICQEQQLFKELRVNMSLKGIIDKGQEVIFKMVEYEIQRHKVFELQSSRELRLYAYHILFGVNEKQMRIYLKKYLSFVFKSFLIIVMRKERMIPLCREIISDQYLIQEFDVTQQLLENTVLYLYRQRLHQQPIYVSNKQYINMLLGMLSSSSHKAKFIVLSEAFAKAFTFCDFHIHYPFFMSYYPTVGEVQCLVNSLSKQEVSSMDYQMLIEIIYMLKILGENYNNIEGSRHYNGSKHYKKAKLRFEILIVFFMKFHREELFQKALQICKHILNIQFSYKRASDIIFPLFLMETLQKELLKRVQQPMVRLVSYYFRQPCQLLEIISKLTSQGSLFTNEEIDSAIESSLSLKHQQLIYNPDNQVFSESFKELIRSMDIEQQVSIINPLLETVWQQISQRREQFQTNYIYSIMYRILLHDPLTLAQYIYRHTLGINTRSLRALITLLGFESIFHMESIILIGQSIFQVLLTKVEPGQHDKIICSEEDLREKAKLSVEDILGNSISIMKEKVKLLAENPQIQKTKQEKTLEIMEIMKDPLGYIERKGQESYLLLQRLYPYRCSPQKKKQILREVLQRNHQHLRYPFDDDDLHYSQSKYDLLMPIKLYKALRVHFNQVAQRSQVNNKLLYVKQPVYRDVNSFSTIELSSKPQFEELYLNIFQSKVKQNSTLILSKKQQHHYHSIKKVRPGNQLFYFGQENQHAQLEAFFKKTCRVEGFVTIFEQNNGQLKQESLIKGNNSSQISLEIIQQEKRQIKNKHSRLAQQIQHFLQGQQGFNLSLLPSCQSLPQKQLFFQETVHQIYSAEEKSLAKRIQLIWLIKDRLFGIQSGDQFARGVTQRLSRCGAATKMFASLEVIFPQTIFSRHFDSNLLLETIKQNANQHIFLKEDYLYLVQIVAQAFCSELAYKQIIFFAVQKIIKELNQNDNYQCREYIRGLIEKASPVEIESYLASSRTCTALDLQTFRIIQRLRNQKAQVADKLEHQDAGTTTEAFQ